MNTLEHIIKKFNLQKVGLYTHIPGSRNKELLELFRELGFTKGAEIGVEAGRYSRQICRMIPGIKLICVDPWKAYEGYREYIDQKFLDGLYKETIERLKPYDCRIIRGESEKVYKKIPDGSLDFVYIDGNHDFLHVTQDIYYWTPKVRVGGIIAGHDFQRNSKRHANAVKDVVPAYAYSAGINPWFILDDGKYAPSWFWVKT